MAIFDQPTLARVQQAIAARVGRLGVELSVDPDAAGDATSPDRSTAVHLLRHGSDTVTTLNFSVALETHARLPEILVAAAQAADDVWRAEASDRTVSQFTERLEQAYEQAHLLFRLARIPKLASEWAPALADAIERLHGITHLGWVSLQFVDSATCVGPLRGRRFVAGSAPVDTTSLATLLDGALTQSHGSVILRTDECELATATGSEVLLQPLTFDGQRLGMLAAGNNGGDDPGLSSFETQLFAACAGYLGTFHANVARIAQQEAMFVGTLRALTASIDAKDPYTCGHSERVALLAYDMALTLGLGEAAAERYRVAGLIHDVGKIGVPEAILCKAGKLTDDEFARIKKHPQIGFDILRDIPGLDDVRPGVLHHHERYDGRGYPHGIAGEAIPPLARVLALADTFDAMSSNRSYRAKLPRDHVLAELTRCAGGQFDPAFVAAFVAMDFSRFDEVLRQHADQFPTPLAIAA